MTVNIDLNEATDPNAAIDDDTYTVEIQEAGLETSKAGDEMVHFELTVVGHDEHTGHYLHDYCMLEGKAAKRGIWKLRQYHEALGLPLGPVDEIDWDQFAGLTLDVVVEKTPPEGEYGEGNRIKTVLV